MIIHHAGNTHRVKHYPGETILETARRHRIPFSSNCERGECGACIVTLLLGEVTMRGNDVLSEKDLEEGLVLGCQSVPVTEIVEVELP